MQHNLMKPESPPKPTLIRCTNSPRTTMSLITNLYDAFLEKSCPIVECKEEWTESEELSPEGIKRTNETFGTEYVEDYNTNTNKKTECTK